MQSWGKFLKLPNIEAESSARNNVSNTYAPILSGLGKSYVAFLTHYIYTILGSNRLEEYFKQFNYDELLNGNY